MNSLRLDHVAIPIRDARASYRFYSETLGLTLIDALSGDDWGGKPWLMMIFATEAGQQIALVAFRGASAPEAQESDERHYAFAVESDKELAVWRERLRSHGVDARDEDHDTQRSIYFVDPNGITLEITTPPSPTLKTKNPKARDVIEGWLGA
jgi:catechol 2,3-dioxygenase-like lactoylglutathione lyase family enzyme